MQTSASDGPAPAPKEADPARSIGAWLLAADGALPADFQPSYGDVTALNTDGLIKRSVEPAMLNSIVSDFLSLLGTSCSIYEKNGDYAFGIFSSGWCRCLDEASFRLCDTDDLRQALVCGKWLCHESCWTEASRTCIERNAPVDIECNGGLRLYAVPIQVDGAAVGAINFGYGSPPRDEATLRGIAEKYGVPCAELAERAAEYPDRPVAIIDLTRRRLANAATQIGNLVKRRLTEEKLRESETTQRGLLETMPTPVFCKDRDGRYTRVNRAFCALYGTTEEALLGKTIFDLASRDLAEVHHAKDLELLQRPGAQFYEIQARDATGQVHDVVVRKATALSARGEPVGIIGAILDVTEMKQAEARLRHQGTMLDMAPASITIHTKEGRFLFANQATFAMHGYTQEEFFALPLGAIDTLESASMIDERVALIEQNGAASFEVTHRRKNGSIFPLKVSTRIVDWDGQPVLLSVAIDITERKEAERQLRESEERHRSLFMTMQEGFALHEIICDTAGRPCDYRYLEVNPAFERATGIPREHWIGHTVREVLPNVEEYWIQCFGQVALTGQAATFENYVRELDRHYEVVAYSPKRGLFAAIALDVTERKRAEATLQHERSLLANITNTSPVGITTVNRAGQITFANRHAETILGLSRESILDRQYNAPEWRVASLDGQPLPDRELPFVRVMTTGQPVHDVRHSILWPNGRRVDLSINAAPMRNEAGEVTGMVAAMINITEQRLLEDRLRQSDKLTAIGQLAGGIAHDFNNQLAGVLGYAEMLVKRLDDPNLRQYASGIQTAALRASDLTKQLLAFSRKGKYLSAPVDAHAIIAEVVAILEHSIDKRIEIRQDLHASPHCVLGDPTQIQSALLNLAINARDAMPHGGRLTFATSVVDLAADPANPELQPGLFVQIAVTDTGCGMGSDTQKHLFEPFFTTKEQGKGTGLGLAAVHGTVRNHHGAIFVESQVGKGTTCRVCLPVLEEPAVVPDHGESKTTAPTGGARILVVEDEAVVREMATESLRMLGYKVTTCENGEEAVRYYADAWPHIDLVILDMVMPRMGGHETFVALRKINPEIKAILSSGHGLDGEAQKILDEGLLGFLQKPYRIAELAQKVTTALREHV